MKVDSLYRGKTRFTRGKTRVYRVQVNRVKVANFWFQKTRFGLLRVYPKYTGHKVSNAEKLGKIKQQNIVAVKRGG